MATRTSPTEDRKQPREPADRWQTALTSIAPNQILIRGYPLDEMTAVASQYYSKLPTRLDGSYVLMIDPMLATGGSAVAGLDLLKRVGAKDIRIVCIVAAPEGVALVEQQHPDVTIFTPTIDRALNERKYIVPGLGDFGDRLYGTASPSAHMNIEGR